MSNIIHEGDEINQEGTCAICNQYFNLNLGIDCHCLNDNILDDYDDENFEIGLEDYDETEY